MRLRMLWLTVGTTAVLGGAALAGCFSERTVASSVEGECRLPVDPSIPGSTIIVIRAFAFEPAEVRVRAGDRVTWVSCDEEAHTTTSDDEVWASSLLPPGDVFTHTFTAAGDFPYHCEPHPFMTGRVIVE